MKLSEYLLDRIFSLIYMLVAALVLLALLWLIETPAVFILFAEVILLAAYSTALLYDFFRKQSFYNLLQKMTEQMDIKTLLGELMTLFLPAIAIAFCLSKMGRCSTNCIVGRIRAKNFLQKFWK